jgi:hypothetical protein
MKTIYEKIEDKANCSFMPISPDRSAVEITLKKKYKKYESSKWPKWLLSLIEDLEAEGGNIQIQQRPIGGYHNGELDVTFITPSGSEWGYGE